MNKLKLFMNKHGGIIMTLAGAGCTIASEILTVRATIKATRIIDEIEAKDEVNLETKEKVKLVYPNYILPSVVCGAGLVCIFFANALNKKQQVALLALCATLSTNLESYKKHSREIMGDEKYNEMENDIACERTNNYVPVKRKYSTDLQNELFYDLYSGTWFEAKKDDFDMCIDDFNNLQEHYSVVSLGDWYRYLQSVIADKDQFLNPSDFDEIGWTDEWPSNGMTVMGRIGVYSNGVEKDDCLLYYKVDYTAMPKPIC